MVYSFFCSVIRGGAHLLRQISRARITKGAGRPRS
jgi:hypothetical protein